MGGQHLVYAFIMALGFSRLSCVIPVFRLELESVINAFAEAFPFFVACPAPIVIDGMKACLALANLYLPLPQSPRANQEHAVQGQ